MGCESAAFILKPRTSTVCLKSTPCPFLELLDCKVERNNVLLLPENLLPGGGGADGRKKGLSTDVEKYEILWKLTHHKETLGHQFSTGY